MERESEKWSATRGSNGFQHREIFPQNPRSDEEKARLELSSTATRIADEMERRMENLQFETP
jgi:hypothetical protein